MLMFQSKLKRKLLVLFQWHVLHIFIYDGLYLGTFYCGIPPHFPYGHSENAL